MRRVPTGSNRASEKPKQQAVGHHKAIAARENTVRGEPQPRARARESAGRKDTTPLAVQTRAVELAGALETSKPVTIGENKRAHSTAQSATRRAFYQLRHALIEPLKGIIIFHRHCHTIIGITYSSFIIVSSSLSHFIVITIMTVVVSERQGCGEVEHRRSDNDCRELGGGG